MRRYLFKISLLFLVLSCQSIEIDNVKKNYSFKEEKNLTSTKLKADAIISSEEFRAFEDAMMVVVKTLSKEMHKNDILKNHINDFQYILTIENDRNLESLVKIFNDFKVTENTKWILLEQAKILQQKIDAIEYNHLKGLNNDEKRIILAYLSLKENNKNARLTSGCCNVYRNALKKCLKDAGYDWLILSGSGISALWNGILMYMNAKACIDQAEEQYAECCETEAPEN